MKVGWTSASVRETRRTRKSILRMTNRTDSEVHPAEDTRGMHKLQGIAVSPGIAIGEALVMDNEGFRIPRRFVARDAVDDELERLEKAIEAAAAEIAGHREAVAKELGEK